MQQMKVDDFIAKLLEIEKQPTLYKLGCFGNKKIKGFCLWDCSGLIKGVLWGYPENGKYRSNGVPDFNANTLIKYCTNVTTDLNKIKRGYMLHMDGHCGIYIGDLKVVESSPKWENGVQITRLNQRKWERCGALPYIDYGASRENRPTELNNALEVIAKYVKKGYFGNGHDHRKEEIYKLIKEEVNK